jgi:hypothetical protein
VHALVPFGVRNGLGELRGEVKGEGVSAVGSVDGDHRDPVDPLGANAVGHSPFLSVPV